MTDPAPASEPRPWLDLPANDLALLHDARVREIADQVNEELVAMQGALEALARHPEATTAREACRLDSAMFRRVAVI